jgi:alginate O-acetyltransferase complex protein AlgI
MPQPSLAQFMAWMLAFPIFTAGPIERFEHFAAAPPSRPTRDQIAAGGIRLLHGLIKKFVLADVVIREIGRPLAASVVDADPQHVPVAQLWWFLGAAFLYNYLDFAAYSDLAVGSCRLLGIEVVENFASPLLASDLGDFWKRWHRSLANWCQAYVYLPVIAATRLPYLAIYATFASIGLWHLGTLNWLCWGLWHGTGVAIALYWTRFKRVRRLPRADGLLAGIPGRLLTLAWVTAGYAFTTIQGEAGVWTSLRIIARLCGLWLPAW